MPNKFPAEKFTRVGARERVELAEKLASGDGDQQGAGGRVDSRGRPGASACRLCPALGLRLLDRVLIQLHKEQGVGQLFLCKSMTYADKPGLGFLDLVLIGRAGKRPGKT
ncbi:MAG: hypothetical protein AB7E78_14085 [Porticoccaceae bacterium]